MKKLLEEFLNQEIDPLFAIPIGHVIGGIAFVFFLLSLFFGWIFIRELFGSDYDNRFIAGIFLLVCASLTLGFARTAYRLIKNK